MQPKRRERVLWGALAAPGMLWLFVFFLVPVGFIIAGSLATTDIIGRPVYGWYPDTYSQVFQGIFAPVVIRSVLFAGATTLACLLIGYPTAYAISRYGGRARLIWMLAIMVPWLADYLIRIYGWVQLLSNNGPVVHALSLFGLADQDSVILGTGGAVLVGLIYNYLPLMILPIYVSVEQLDKNLIEAGRDLYGSARAVFLHVTLPNTLPGVVSGSLLVALLALGDWATASLLGGSEQYMIGNLIQDQLNNSGSLPFGSALTVVLLTMIALVLALSVAARPLLRRRGAA